MPITATRQLALALASLLVLSATEAGHARDGRGFFEQPFGAPARSAPQPVYDRSGFDPFGDDARSDRPVSRRHRLRARYAALPRAEDEAKRAGKQPVDQKAIADNPTKAILADRTLRPGDIVMLPGGPRVFTGGSDKRHRLGDFEDVRHSSLIDRKTRNQLLAMTVPVGAMPADQARKRVAQKRKLARPDEIAEVEAQQVVARNEAGTRVIDPWKSVR